MISTERIDDLHWCWSSESNDPETLEWRDDLNDEECALVDAWDHQYDEGIQRLSKEFCNICKSAKAD